MEHNFDSFYDFGKYKVIDCETCKYKHLSPMPSDEDLNEFYSNHYFENILDVDKYVLNEKQKEEYINQIKANGLLNFYYNKITAMKKSTGKRMLDIGCAASMYMLIFSINGWETVGVEPSKSLCHFNEQFGSKVYNCTIDEFDFNCEEKFDFINLSFVIEHIKNPREILEKCFNALNPGGVLYLAVPNEFNIFQMAYAKKDINKMFWVQLPDHMNYFNFKSIEKLIDSVGFKLEYKTTNFPVDMFLAQGIDYKNDKVALKNISEYISNFENNMIESQGHEALMKYYENLASIEIGRACILYMSKPL